MTASSKAKPTATRAKSCNALPRHRHMHGPGCGHKAVKHGSHTDYLHSGKYHRVHGDHADECRGAEAG